MKQIETANKFVETMIDAEGKLLGVKNLIDEKKSSVQKVINNFNDEQGDIIRGVESEIKSEDAKKVFEGYKKALTEIVQKNNQDHEDYIKGAKFIEDFEETFIVSVFGKVKSGKSYLGNYIMGNAFKGRNTAYDKLGDISVHVYDRGKESTASKLSEMIDETDGQGFGVAATEATSTIQFFKIGGLTWCDTPGIGSITKENEELANKYIKNSDLVVFAMNSDAAGTKQELEELKELYDMNKPMIILITQSDFYDIVDYDDDGNAIRELLPKSEKDRQDVEDYLIEEIKKQGCARALELSGGKTLTISTKLAVEALKEQPINQKMYESSNMDIFVNRLIDITRGQAAEMKERNPKDRFNKLISDLLVSIDDLNSKIKEQRDEAVDIENDALKIKKNVIQNVRNRAQDEITKIVSESTKNVKNTTSQKTSTTSKDSTMITKNIFSIFNEDVSKNEMDNVNRNSISGEDIAKKVANSVNKIIVEECMEGMKKLIPDIESKNIGNVMDSNKMKVSDLGEKMMDQSYDVEILQRRKVARGLFGRIMDLFDGGKYETITKKVKRTVSISMGVNSYEVEDQLLNQFENISNSTLDMMLSGLIDGYVEPLKLIYKQISDLTDKTIKKLENLKIQ